MSLYDAEINTLKGEPADLAQFKDKAVLVVNVASRCGLTPQYAGLEDLQRTYEDRGFTVLGVPCNQFGNQEPGSADEIETFCSTTYGVTFPMLEKVDVNGENQHPLFAELNQVPDDGGHTGDVRWNFEKFLVAPGGGTVKRFNPTIKPDDPRLVEAIEEVLPN